jgi:hypothetical protein
MGDETAALVGFILRIVLVILLAAGAVRLVWGMIGGSSEDQSLPPGPRREPTFGRREESFSGRREPTLGVPSHRSADAVSRRRR